MTRWTVFLVAVAATAATACATDDGSGADRGGPDALTGFAWQSKASANGINFLFGFQFTAANVMASNTCSLGGQQLTASVSVPVKYRYRAEIPSGGRKGDSACFVEVLKGSFDAELAGDKLLMTVGGKTIEWASAGGRSGIYGDWTATVDGLTLTWSMGGGKIRARAACPGGTTAEVSVSAEFKNFVDILEAGSKQVGDESFSCSISVAKAMAGYRFDGDDLVLTIDGKDTRFEHD
ncbi:MAG: hypothetical protein M4D80_09105 [Myxococcota bacterium]|nr:hypothetical protein [Deltaproteobacteria bacterium]MDQ3335309.1 hypothetical protein [Myxococcota bacterium]